MIGENLDLRQVSLHNWTQPRLRKWATAVWALFYVIQGLGL